MAGAHKLARTPQAKEGDTQEPTSMEPSSNSHLHLCLPNHSLIWFPTKDSLRTHIPPSLRAAP